MNNKFFIKLAGLLAILSTVGYVLTINRADRVLYGWAGLIATVLAGPAYMGVYLFLKNDENARLAKLGTYLMMAGLPLVAGIYVTAYIEAVLNAPVYDGAIDLMNIVNMDGGSFLTFGVGGIFLSLASRRTTLPGWFQWLGIVAGILGLFWFGFNWMPGFKQGDIGFFIPIIGMMLSLIWQLLLGVYMLRAK